MAEPLLMTKNVLILWLLSFHLLEHQGSHLPKPWFILFYRFKRIFVITNIKPLTTNVLPRSHYFFGLLLNFFSHNGVHFRVSILRVYLTMVSGLGHRRWLCSVFVWYKHFIAPHDLILLADQPIELDQTRPWFLTPIYIGHPYIPLMGKLMVLNRCSYHSFHVVVKVILIWIVNRDEVTIYFLRLRPKRDLVHQVN